MIRNKQVNLWRGPDPPPTIYHIWLKDESQLLRFDDDLQKWEVFLDSKGIAQKLVEFMEILDELAKFTINGKNIKDDPVLDGTDILINYNGNYVKADDTIQQSIATIDKLLTTKVYDGQ